jgi:hypothetical protein
MDSRTFRERLQRSKHLALKNSLYHWKNIEVQMSKMAYMTICNTSYGKNKGRKSNMQFDSQPQKISNRPNPRVCMWRVTHHWKALDESYNFASNLISIRGLSVEL